MSANSAPSMSSAALVPAVATSNPPSPGPSMKHTEKSALATALPSRRRPAAWVTATVAARASARAVRAASPSSRARARTTTTLT